MVRGCNTCDLAHRMTSPTPLLSCLVSDCLESGRDVTEGGARYNPSGVQGVGTANLADSLETLRRGVFGITGADGSGRVEPIVGYGRLAQALARDWSGEGDELLRRRIVDRMPKYGNDVDEVDLLGSRMLEFYAREVEKYGNVRDGFFQPGSYTVSAHVPLGAACGATPDGRHAHEALADGGLSPMRGLDKHGPTASLMSVSKLNNGLESERRSAQRQVLALDTRWRAGAGQALRLPACLLPPGHPAHPVQRRRQGGAARRQGPPRGASRPRRARGGLQRPVRRPGPGPARDIINRTEHEL